MLLALRNFIFREDGICGAFRLTEGAINTLIRVDDKKVRAFVKTIHRANIHAIGVLALDAVFCDYESHYIVLSSEMMTVALSLGPYYEEAMKGKVSDRGVWGVGYPRGGLPLSHKETFVHSRTSGPREWLAGQSFGRPLIISRPFLNSKRHSIKEERNRPLKFLCGGLVERLRLFDLSHGEGKSPLRRASVYVLAHVFGDNDGVRLDRYQGQR